MINSRLSGVSEVLDSRLRTCSAAQRRAAVLAACESAVARSGLNHPLATEILDLLKSEGRIRNETKAAIHSLTERLDLKYLRLNASRNPNFDAVGAAFALARAAMSLDFAARTDSIEDAIEAVYEAVKSHEDEETLVNRLLEITGGQSSHTTL